MHLIFLLGDVHFIVRVGNCWTDFVFYLSQSFLVFNQFLFVLVQLFLDLFDLIKLLSDFILHLLDISL